MHIHIPYQRERERALYVMCAMYIHTLCGFCEVNLLFLSIVKVVQITDNLYF